MPILWTVLLILCAGLMLAGALKCGEPLGSRPVVRSRSFWCPFRTRNVTVEFNETYDGRRFAVRRCSALPSPTAIACDAACVGLARLPARRWTEGQGLFAEAVAQRQSHDVGGVVPVVVAEEYADRAGHERVDGVRSPVRLLE